VLVLSQGGQLLLDQAITGFTSRVGGFTIWGGAQTVAPRSFLDRYSKLPAGSIASLLFATILPSSGASVIQVEGGRHHVPSPVRHGSLPSCPDPISINVPSYALPSLRYGGHGLVPYILVPPYVCSPPASRVDYFYGGFVHAAPPPAKDFNSYHPHSSHPSHHGGHPSTHASSSVLGGVSFYSSGCSFICVRRWHNLSPGSWGVSLCGCIGYHEPRLCGLINSPFFAAEQSPFLFWLRHHNVLFQP
jgi:hypothetical protein